MVIRSSLRRRLCSEGGFGLIELMVGIIGTLVVFFAVSSFWKIAADNQAGTGNRVEALAQQRVGLEQMTRELRGARAVQISTAGDVVEFDLYEPVTHESGDSGEVLVEYGWRHVVYDCSQDQQCLRYEGAQGGPLDGGFEPLVCVPPSTPDPTPGELSSLHDVAECELEASFTLMRDRDRQPCDPAVDLLEDCNYLEIALDVSLAERNTPIALEDGVHLRNRGT